MNRLDKDHLKDIGEQYSNMRDPPEISIKTSFEKKSSNELQCIYCSSEITEKHYLKKSDYPICSKKCFANFEL